MKMKVIAWIFSVLISVTIAEVVSTSGPPLEDYARNLTGSNHIAQMLDFFNMERVANNWPTISPELTKNCSRDIQYQFQGLADHQLWALKMDDASGHYSSGFFYGNNYWTGSISLCSQIFVHDLDEVNKLGRVNKKTGLSFTANNQQMQKEYMEYQNPPFKPGYYVLKTYYNESTVTSQPRIVFLGLCLPESCSTDEVLTMARLSKPEESMFTTSYIEVRSPTQKLFNLWTDRTFIILVVTSILVGMLMVGGTGYDLYLTKREKQKQKMKNKDLASDSSSGTGCTTYDLTKGIPNNKLGCGLEITRSVNNNNSDENLTMGDMSQSEDEEELTVWEELLLSFSMVTNFKAICDSRVGSDTISSIHGLRAISMAWVILGHTCIIIFKYSDNMELRKVVEKEFIFQAITNGPFSVDTFFVISGFLVSFIYFRTNAKGKLEKLSKNVNEFTAGAFHFVGLIGYRFVRLTTPYMFVLGCVEVIMKYYEQYSIFEPPTLDHENCPKYWWRNFLYINTLFPVNEMCMLWSWYLSNDTQFYIIGAIILIIAVRHFRTAATILSTFMISSWLTTGIIAYNNNHIPNTDDPLALFDMIYDKPWTRIGPYMIGMIVGWILFKTDCKVKMSKLVATIGWSLSSFIGLFLVFGLYYTHLDKIGGAAYSSLSHSAWALSTAWVIFACSTGYGGWVNKLLSSPLLYPFSRTTYCAYLVHPIVIRIMALNATSPLHLGKDLMIIYFFGQIVCSYIIAFVVSVAFEAPVVTMLKIITPNRKKRV